MIRALSKRFMALLEQKNLRLETGSDPAPTQIPQDYYCVCDTTTGEPLASVWEVDPRTSEQEIEQHLMAQLTEDGIA